MKTNGIIINPEAIPRTLVALVSLTDLIRETADAAILGIKAGNLEEVIATLTTMRDSVRPCMMASIAISIDFKELDAAGLAEMKARGGVVVEPDKKETATVHEHKRGANC